MKNLSLSGSTRGWRTPRPSRPPWTSHRSCRRPLRCSSRLWWERRRAGRYGIRGGRCRSWPSSTSRVQQRWGSSQSDPSHPAYWHRRPCLAEDAQWTSAKPPQSWRQQDESCKNMPGHQAVLPSEKQRWVFSSLLFSAYSLTKNILQTYI